MVCFLGLREKGIGRKTNLEMGNGDLAEEGRAEELEKAVFAAAAAIIDRGEKSDSGDAEAK